MQRGTNEEAVEEIRDQMVKSMRNGKLMVINLQNAKPDFKTTFNLEIFPTDRIFNFGIIKDHVENKKLLKDDENFNMLGDKGLFYMNEEFRLCILAKYKNEEDCKQLLDCIPDSENFLKFIVE
uniref:Uncharacterized protein n=1 Tax=Strombidium rassoulzadegani TaxID=1082188 RepID=A0A7S3FUN3_9SPIT|mmetsp:Transcript_17680/g.29882  ORF Transcript_17680/g.29882 Transcript_17680/m.29882 type:complete len:123 (+) Transcript_17680:196-564(+)